MNAHTTKTNHHARALGRASVAGEAIYHSAELAGEHHLLLLAAAVLLLCLLLRVLLHVPAE